MAEKLIGRNVPDGADAIRILRGIVGDLPQIDPILIAQARELLESRPVQQPAQLIAAQQAEDEGLWCIPKTAMEGHLQKELRRLTEAVEGKTSAECLRELLLKPPVQQPATEPDETK